MIPTQEDIFAGRAPGYHIGYLSIPEAWIDNALRVNQGGRLAFWHALSPIAWTGTKPPSHITEGET